MYLFDPNDADANATTILKGDSRYARLALLLLRAATQLRAEA